MTPTEACLPDALDFAVWDVFTDVEGGPRFLYSPVTDTTALAQTMPCQPAWDAPVASDCALKRGTTH